MTPQRFKQSHFDAALFVKKNKLKLASKNNNRFVYTTPERTAVYFIQQFANVTVVYVYDNLLEFESKFTKVDICAHYWKISPETEDLVPFNQNIFK